MTDIVERLQEMLCWLEVSEPADAIAEVTRLREEVERLRGRLEASQIPYIHEEKMK